MAELVQLQGSARQCPYNWLQQSRKQYEADHHPHLQRPTRAPAAPYDNTPWLQPKHLLMPLASKSAAPSPAVMPHFTPLLLGPASASAVASRQPSQLQNKITTLGSTAEWLV
jgi:hypothetical protein